MSKSDLVPILLLALLLTGLSVVPGMAQEVPLNRLAVNVTDTLGGGFGMADEPNPDIANDTAAQSTQKTGFDYPDFGSTAGLNLVGNAAKFNDRLRLTPDLNDQAGAAWYTTPQFVQEGFETTFQFQITNTGNDGADGFAFVIQNNSISALGSSGSGIGYEGITNCLAIEFDTYEDQGRSDPNDNHISVQPCETADHPYSLGYTTAITDISNGSVHTVTIEYMTNTLRIFLDTPSLPVLTVYVDIATVLSLDNGRAWAGFTAGTNGDWESHDILSWSFCHTANTCNPVSITALTSDSPVELGEVMNFTATVTGTQPITYNWDFGDAGTQGGTDTNPTFTYNAAGAYTVTLDVANACGTDSDFIRVTVTPPVCNPVSITALMSDSPVELGEVMNFTATVTGTQPITYTWDFDDDGTPEQSGVGLDTVSHTFASAGSYTVTLDVENGCPFTDTDFITVTVGGDVELYAQSVVTSVGGAAFHHLVITNTGTTASTFALTYTSSSTWTVYFSPVDVITIPAGLTGTVDLIVEFPWYAAPFVTHTVTVTVTPQTGAPVAIMLTSNTGCRFDFVPNGIIDINDILVIINCFGRLNDPYCDVVHDGVVDVNDINRVIDRFGELCQP